MATIADFMREWESDSSYIIAHTSGSTGAPKEIRLLKSDMLASASATNDFFGIGPASVLALPLSPDYIAGKMMAVRAWLAGAVLLELPVSNNIVLDRDVDLLAVVPSQIPSLLANGSINNVKNLLVGGAPLPDDLSARLIAGGVRAYVGYGMTETCSHVALRHVGDGMYHAMPGITFSQDERGCLVIESDRFSWRRLVTNDVVQLADDGRFCWLGRADNVIISGGLKIHPELLEAEIRHLFPDMPPFYITKEPDQRWGEVPVLVTEPGAHVITTDILKLRLSDPRHTPARIISIPALPVTGHKILRLTPDKLLK